MSALLEPTPAAPPAPPAPDSPPPAEPEAVVVERPCATCGAALAEGQDWCLECGSAQPGRLGGKPGWRAALTIVGATALLATGAGAAAYAALDSESKRDATAQAPPAAQPTIQQPPANAAPPATTTPDAATTPGAPSTVDPPASDPADVPEAKGDADGSSTSTPSTPSTSTPSTPSTSTPSTPSDTGTGSGTTTEPADPEPVAIELKDDAAAIYDPYKRAGTADTKPELAIDGKDETAWEAPVGPDGQVRLGLVISLDQAQKLGDLEFKADTPGFTVESYGTRSTKVPPDVLDARWKHLDDVRDVGVRETLKLDGEYRHILLWITAQPADTKVAIPEIELFSQED